MAQSTTLGQRSPIPDSTIEEIRNRIRLGGLVAHRVKLTRAGRGWKGLCPFHAEQTPSFTVADEKGFFHCFGCGAHGDCFQWVQDIDGVDFREAVVRCAAVAGVTIEDRPSGPSAALDGRVAADIAQRETDHREAPDVVSSTTAGRWIWRTAGPARGEIVEAWLESRGCDPLAKFDGVSAAIDQLRFHPRCPLGAWKVGDDPASAFRTAPAMIAPIRDGDGLIRGVHVTYLSPDGKAKANLGDRPTRKMFGKVQGNAVWLTPFDAKGSAFADAPLIVGEGIETSWSFAQTFGHPCHVAAALSLDNLQGGAKRIGGGALPLWNVEADFERPPFLVPETREVVILVDADMKPLRGQRIQRTRGEKPVRGDIGGLERATICARLAHQHWTRAGAAKVTCVRPRMGLDFNDAVRSHLPGEGASGAAVRSAA